MSAANWSSRCADLRILLGSRRAVSISERSKTLFGNSQSSFDNVVPVSGHCMGGMAKGTSSSLQAADGQWDDDVPLFGLVESDVSTPQLFIDNFEFLLGDPPATATQRASSQACTQSLYYSQQR